MILLFYILCLLYPSVTYSSTVFVAPNGDDFITCVNVSETNPKKTINGGISCLQPGDTLFIKQGEYNELVVAGTLNLAPIRNVQPNTYNIPNGVSLANPTTIIGKGKVWIKPTLARYPGGGGAITTNAPSRYIKFENISVDGINWHSRAVVLEGQQIFYEKGEVTKGWGMCIASQTQSDTVIMRDLHVHHCGLLNTEVYPLPHAMYICGANKIMERLHVHHAQNRGIQLSCEQGGISNNIIRYNYIHDVNVGIQLQGHNNLVHNNVIAPKGVGIWIGGGNGGEVYNNTIYGHELISDNYGILASNTSGPLLRDNIIMKQRVISSTSFNRYIHGANSTPRVERNMFDITPPGGVKPQFVALPYEVFIDPDANDFRLTANSPAKGVGLNGENLGADIFLIPALQMEEVAAPTNFKVRNN